MASWAQNSRSGRLWGGLGGSLGGHFERCWLEVGLSWLMLELCCVISGDKMAAKMAILAIKSAKMSQDGAQEVAKLSSDGILGSKLKLLLQFWCYFDCFLADYLHIKKLQKKHEFLKVFSRFGGPAGSENQRKFD